MIIPPMTDKEFADWLRMTPRTPSVEPATGPWVGNQIVHHCNGESRQQ